MVGYPSEDNLVREAHDHPCQGRSFRAHRKEMGCPLTFSNGHHLGPTQSFCEGLAWLPDGSEFRKNRKRGARHTEYRQIVHSVESGVESGAVFIGKCGSRMALFW